ncbi:MAG: hypothetical protein H0X40_17120 [Chthoniobacterales bacterium]|nr:hypothetical protein [Chthoniobacterales bacterium]
MQNQPNDPKATHPEEKDKDAKRQQPTVKVKDLVNHKDPMGGRADESPKETMRG